MRAEPIAISQKIWIPRSVRDKKEFHGQGEWNFVVALVDNLDPALLLPGSAEISCLDSGQILEQPITPGIGVRLHPNVARGHTNANSAI